MKKNFLDRAIEILSPQTALNRYKSRSKLRLFNDVLSEVRQHGRKYDAAGKSRHHADWVTANLSPNQEVNAALNWLRDRSRDLGRNNPYARRVFRLLPNNVVGSGIIPTPTNVRSAQIKALKNAWSDWATKLDCDYDKNYNFTGLQWLICRTVVESGECLVRKVKAGSNYKVPIRLQVLEGDYIDTTHHSGKWISESMKDPYIDYYGIRFNKKGEKIGYWLWDQHPSEFPTTSTMVSAADIIHVYEVERPGQIRGIPIMASVMLRMRDLDDYEFTERIRNKIAACFTVFIQDDSESTESTPYETEKIEPGAIERLPPGKSVTVAQPPGKEGFGEYVKANLRGIAAGVGASYEAVTGDYSNVNFSSGRMGWLEFAREVEQWQFRILIPKLCDRVYEWFAEAAAFGGYIPFNIPWKVTWTAPRREMIDPLKELQSIKLQLRLGIVSWQDVVKQFGYIPDELKEELKMDAGMWDELALKPEGDPRFDTNRQVEDLGPDKEDSQSENLST
jgi:lambda family phage portal protein